MNYPNILRTRLLSQSNIDFLVNTILSNFKISGTAIDKCINIIKNNFIKYLDNIDTTLPSLLRSSCMKCAIKR